MKLFKISLILLAIFIIYGEASVVKHRRSAANDGIADDLDDDDGNSIEDINKDDNFDNGDDEMKDLKTVAIKSRVITMDRELCRELSRYHPHYPKCQLYCENLKHWMGMCRRGDTCHCYS